MEQQVEEKIKQMILDCGADVCGIGNIDRFLDVPAGFSPIDSFKNCRSVISFGVALPKGLYDVESRLIYGHYNYLLLGTLDDIALKGAKLLEKEYGAIAVPMPSDSPYEYWDKDTLTGKGLISMKHTAAVCGLGELGKNTLLINKVYGNRLVLGAILTDLELKSDPLSEHLCIAKCRKCIDSCPAHAIADGTVIQKSCRLNTYGETARGFETVDCNKCRVVCPMRFGNSK